MALVEVRPIEKKKWHGKTGKGRYQDSWQRNAGEEPDSKGP